MSKTYIDKNGYRRFSSSHKLVHRWVARKTFGRRALGRKQVHHIDGNKLNNNPDNLKIVSRYEHEKIHGLPHKRDCFIATAAYGTPFATEINILRTWRDSELSNHIIGRMFIRSYYVTSPPFARLIEKNNELKRLVRWILAPLINYLNSKIKPR